VDLSRLQPIKTKYKHPIPAFFLLHNAIEHRAHAHCPICIRPVGYDYAGHGSKRESDDKKRLLVCLHFITRGSEAMARQLIDHLIKNNDFGYLPPDLGHTPDIAAKIMIADNISSKNDPLFLAQLYVQESTTHDTSQEVVFVKREARVLVNGKGFRYRVQTGELISATRRTTRSSSTAGEFQLQPTACRAIQASLYAQV